MTESQLNFEEFLEALARKMKSQMSSKLEQQFSEFLKKKKELEDTVIEEDSSQESLEALKIFNFSVNFEDLFMDDKMLNEMKNTLKRITYKLSRKNMMQEGDETQSVYGRSNIEGFSLGGSGNKRD